MFRGGTEESKATGSVELLRRRDGDDGGVGQTVSMCEGSLAIFGRHASSGGTDKTGGDWTRGIGRL